MLIPDYATDFLATLDFVGMGKPTSISNSIAHATKIKPFLLRSLVRCADSQPRAWRHHLYTGQWLDTPPLF